MNHGIAFAELVSYMEETCKDDLIAPVFKLKDLTVLYGNRLNQLGTNISGRVHSTKLKDRILAYFPDIEAHKQGRDVVLIYNKDIGSALRKACEHDADDDAILAKAAKIVRRDMFKLKNKFIGSFAPHCQERSVPTSLLSLVAMVLCGPSIEIQSSTTLSQPILTILNSQLLMHNSLDTDVVVLAVASAQWLDLDELWIAFGIGENFRFFAAHEIAKTLGPDQLFHAFTGCDTVSFFWRKRQENCMEYLESIQIGDSSILCLGS